MSRLQTKLALAPYSPVSGYGVWWAALPAVPRSKQATDWWAQDDGRCSRYDRLKRVWFDHTRTDKMAMLRFYNPATEDHLTSTFFENLSVFDPKEWLPRLFKAGGLAAPQEIIDCCWSYEHESRGNTGQADIVIHYRDTKVDGIVVIESKRKGGALKPADRQLTRYLNLPEFAFASRRHLLFLVDEHDLRRRMNQIRTVGGECGWLTWQGLRDLQVSLTNDLACSPETRAVIRRGIQLQAFDLGISGATNPAIDSALECELCEALAIEPDPMANDERGEKVIEAARGLPERDELRDFVAGVIQYWWCRKGICPKELAFKYLYDEPWKYSITADNPFKQTTAERQRINWELP